MAWSWTDYQEPKVLLAGPERLLHLPALAHVADGGDDHVVPPVLEGAEADLDRELGAVLPQGEKSERRAHPPRLRILEIGRPMLHVASPEALREEHLDVLPDELSGAVAEQALGLPIDEPDPTGLVGDSPVASGTDR